MKDEAKIICPNCGTAIDVNNYVNSQIELITHEEKRRIEDKFNKESQANQRKLEIEIDKLKKEQERIDTEKQNISNTINKEVTLKLQSEKYDIEKAVKSQIEAEKSFEIQKLKEQIEEKNRQLKENIELKIQLEQIKFEKDTAEQRITLQKDKELAGKINEEKINIKKSIEDEYILKIREFEKKLDDQTKLAEEMKRKAEQGSMQMQGEVQELELENIIKDISPFDQIQEIKKGQRGADLIHNVYNEQMQFCGTI